ncbi:MAG: histidine kinase [Scytolyngbya sp. HA4215-MV1]|jgi:hypothetical protein|nr:histidine kinase [Scytolyngbya sp. HA4215-MV1]
MQNSTKEKIVAELQQVKEVGQQRVERLREIVRSAAAQLTSEFKEGSGDFKGLVRDLFSSAISGVEETSTEAKAEVAAMVEGLLEGISGTRQQAIAKTEAEIKQLQSKLSEQEEALEAQIDSSLVSVQEAAAQTPAQVKELIDEAIGTLKNSEEVTLLKRRYAQLQAQAAILRANLTARTGGYYDRAQQHLAEAQSWYAQARPKAEVAKGQADQQFAQLEAKLGEAGTALAKKEHQVRSVLSDLLQRASEIVRESGEPENSQPLTKLPPSDEPPLES